jgi:hypothetical protein
MKTNTLKRIALSLATVSLLNVTTLVPTPLLTQGSELTLKPEEKITYNFKKIMSLQYIPIRRSTL